MVTFLMYEFMHMYFWVYQVLIMTIILWYRFVLISKIFIFLCRVEDLCVEGLKTCYFLDFLGPKGFAAELSQRTMCQ